MAVRYSPTNSSSSIRPSFLTNIISLLLLFFLGCFTFPSSHRHRRENRPLKKRTTQLSALSLHPSGLQKLKPQKAWSFIKRILSSSCKHSATATAPHPHPHPTSTLPSPASSTRSLCHHSSAMIIPGLNTVPTSDPTRNPQSESDISSPQQYHFLPLRNDIYPCPHCGEIFPKPNLLDLHQSLKHAVSELLDHDTGNNIIRIIFSTGWPVNPNPNPNISRVFKIHNSAKILNKFEEYRESVKLKASRHAVSRRRDERCIADGNELLRFHCAMFLCDLGQNGNSSICNHQYCSVCGIIRSGFSLKMDGISTLSTSWRAHLAIPEEIEEEFKFMHLKRAMLVCRVIAGRVGCEPNLVDKDDIPGYDSLVGRDGGFHMRLDEEDELLVFNPRAVLPCFVIVYTV